MNSNAKCFLAFVLGGATGAGVAYIFTRKKYEAIAEKEITSARDSYNRLKSELAEKNEKEKMKIFSEYTQKVEESINNAIADSQIEELVTPTETQQTVEVEKPQMYMDDDFTEDEYVMNNPRFDDTPVTPSTVNQTSVNTPQNPIYELDAKEYGGIDSYKLLTLNYYSDGVVTDENDEVIEDPETIISPLLFDKLHIYEMNDIYTAYVRNDVRRCDYEIFLTGTTYEG